MNDTSSGNLFVLNRVFPDNADRDIENSLATQVESDEEGRDLATVAGLITGRCEYRDLPEHHKVHDWGRLLLWSLDPKREATGDQTMGLNSK